MEKVAMGAIGEQSFRQNSTGLAVKMVSRAIKLAAYKLNLQGES